MNTENGEPGHVEQAERAEATGHRPGQHVRPLWFRSSVPVHFRYRFVIIRGVRIHFSDGNCRRVRQRSVAVPGGGRIAISGRCRDRRFRSEGQTCYITRALPRVVIVWP